MGAFATMTSKGQLTIPKEVRDALKLETGTRLYVTVSNGQIVARPKNKKLADLAGILGKPPSGEILSIEDMNEAVKEAVAEEWDDFERRNRQPQP
ncbi:MAG: AbrB/MazE/SpoVT family DNA-binding domain-containing protein [Rhizobiaceae bacterium]|nr:AbrB/MazE/SpoVT family DNA-binding domain-containing protein [Rhizobiaceae bacterium]